jgi:hypothetical protein
MRLLCIAAAALVLCHASIAVASTIHLYRFEDSPGYLVDSAGSADLTPVGVSQVDLPETGRGSSFLTWDGGNASALDVTASGRGYAGTSPITGDFTAEAFVHFDTLPEGNYGAHIVGFAQTNELSMDGLVDEVRISDTVLAEEGLLLGSGMLGLAIAGRRRSH